MTTPLPTPAKNFFDYPAKERKKIVKKATEESNRKQAEIMKSQPPAKEFEYQYARLTEKEAAYLLNHDKSFLKGWQVGIEQADKKLKKIIKEAIDRALPKGDFEYLRANEKRGGFFGYWVAKLDNKYLRKKLSTVLYLLK